MAAYEPLARRPIATMFRRSAQGAVRLCVRRNIHPDLISYLSIVAAIVAGWCYWQAHAVPILLLVAPVFGYVRLWCNMLDGMVALASGKASRSGEIINELPDRFSDVIILVAVGHSGWCHPLGGYWSAIFALLTAYVGTLGQAVGAQRQFGGVMAKPWRMVMLHLGAWLTLGGFWWGHGPLRYGGLTVLDWTHLLIIAGCVQTIWVRLRRILRTLAAQAEEP